MLYNNRSRNETCGMSAEISLYVLCYLTKRFVFCFLVKRVIHSRNFSQFHKHVTWESECCLKDNQTLHKKWSFPLRISSVNVTQIHRKLCSAKGFERSVGVPDWTRNCLLCAVTTFFQIEIIYTAYMKVIIYFIINTPLIEFR